MKLRPDQYFDAGFVAQYLSKGGQLPQIGTEWSFTQVDGTSDINTEGKHFTYPSFYRLPNGLWVPRWRLFGAEQIFGMINAWIAEAPIVAYGSFETILTFVSLDAFLAEYPMTALPLQPRLGFTPEQIDNHWKYRL